MSVIQKILLKLTQAVILSINAYYQDMIAVWNEKKIKNRDRWNYFHHMPILPLLGANNRPPLVNMAKRFIWINEAKNHINEFSIGYMIITGLNANKLFIYQVEKCMYNKFGEITQPFIKATLSKNNTSVLALLMFHETRS